eukprot:XP_016878965.1 LYR motif-containing protein 1 isoform X2 [Homo sapiens]
MIKENDGGGEGNEGGGSWEIHPPPPPRAPTSQRSPRTEDQSLHPLQGSSNPISPGPGLRGAGGGEAGTVGTQPPPLHLSMPPRLFLNSPPPQNSQLLQRFLQSNPFWKRRRPGGSKPPTIPARVSRLPTPAAAASSSTTATASSSSAAHRRRPPRSPAPSIASCIITSGNPAGRQLQEGEWERGKEGTSGRLRHDAHKDVRSRRQMTTATRQEVLGLYRSIFRLARKWQATSGQMEDTIKEKQYILNEARTLFRKNKNIHLPPMGLTPLRGRGLRSQEKLRKLSKPVYLRSHDEVS